MFPRLPSIPAFGVLLGAMLGVCLAQPPPLDSLHAAATVVTVSGQVSVLRDSQPWALLAGAEVKPRQIIITGADGYAKFKLSDGSTFEVFPNAQVKFRDTPGDWRDLLELLLGRIKVHIQKWGGQPNENKISTPTALISVRGTTFDVVVEDDSTLVSVEEGQVEVRHRLQAGEPKLLNPGESLRIYKDVPLARQRIDKGSAVQAALRAMQDALYTIVYRTPRGASPVPGGGPTPPVGDSKDPGGGQKNPGPPPAPPPDPGPPPPPGP